MILWLLLQLTALSPEHFSYACTTRYTRKALATHKRWTRESFRGARDLDKEQNQDDPGSCAARYHQAKNDPLGRYSGGSVEATGCERFQGISLSFQDIQTPDQPIPLGFYPNTCEKYCLDNEKCDGYVYDCKLNLCLLKKFHPAIKDGFVIESRRYISGNKSQLAPKACIPEKQTGMKLRQLKVMEDNK